MVRLPQAWRCEPEAGAVLEELAARGYRLGVASNYDRRLRPVVEGLPALRRLAGPGPTSPTDSAFLIAHRVRAALPGNAEVDTLWRRVSSPISLKTRTPGARVSWTAYRGDTSSWHPIGTTPIDSVAVPAGRAAVRLPAGRSRCPRLIARRSFKDAGGPLRHGRFSCSGPRRQGEMFSGEGLLG